MGESFVNGGVGTTSTCAACLSVMVTVAAQGFANEISWQINGADVYGLYNDFSNNTHELCLHAGEHQINFFDANDDGWHGGTIEVFGDNAHVGPITVSGGGDTVQFWVEPPCVPTTVNVQTAIYGYEVTWQLDGGAIFGPYGNYETDTASFCLSVGQHQLSYWDSYGDGWHGGYIEVIGPESTFVSRTYVTGIGDFTAFDVPSPSAGCEDWGLHLSDTGGDGWGGATLTVYNCHGDPVLADITLQDGSEGTVDICLQPEVGYRIVVDGAGSSSDIEWWLRDQTGSALIAGGAPFDGFWGECPCAANGGDWRLNLLGSRWNVSTCDMLEISNGATHSAVEFAHDVCLPSTASWDSSWNASVDDDADHHYVIDSAGGDYHTHWHLYTQAGAALLSGDIGVVSTCGGCMSSDGTPILGSTYAMRLMDGHDESGWHNNKVSASCMNLCTAYL